MSKQRGGNNSPIGQVTAAKQQLLDNEYLLQGQSAQTYRSTIPPWALGTAAMGNMALSATGVGLSAAIALQQGDVVTNISYITATTGSSATPNQYVALYENNTTPGTPALVCTSGTLAVTRSANTLYTIKMSTQYTVPVTNVYYISISFTAGTVPTILGGTAFNAVDTASLLGSSILAQSHGAALGGVAPATITGATTVAKMPFFIIT
jgi:hypothetical protein